jgi:hypothetical protein
MVCQYAAPYPIPGLQHYNLHIGGRGYLRRRRRRRRVWDDLEERKKWAEV